MHLRRALLLFAIVLGLAAAAASLSRPRDANQQTDPSRSAPPATRSEEPATLAPREDAARSTVEVTFFAADPEAQRIEAGQAATVFVDVEQPGQVAIAELGITDTAAPLTPARFEVLTSATGRYPITFEPATEDEQRSAGTLVVAESEE